MIADGNPPEVLNHYQKLIMAREEAYVQSIEATPAQEVENQEDLDDEVAPPQFTFRHGDGSAEVLRVELLDENRQRIELVETGESVLVRVRVRFCVDTDDPVCGSVDLCAIGGNTEVIEHLQRKLGIEPGQVTPDGRFSLQFVECLGACDTAPCAQINDDDVPLLDAAKVDELLARLR